jgi:hypothetical protein
MGKLYIPRQVIMQLVKYEHDGCMLEVQDEVFNGQPLRRYIADGNLVLWTEPLINSAPVTPGADKEMK